MELWAKYFQEWTQIQQEWMAQVSAEVAAWDLANAIYSRGQGWSMAYDGLAEGFPYEVLQAWDLEIATQRAKEDAEFAKHWQEAIA